MNGGQAAEIPPVISIRSKSNGAAIVSKNLARKGLRPVGEDGVVLGEAFFRCRGRGDDDDGKAAEVKVHHGAMLVRQSSQSAVRRRFEEVEVAA